MPFQEFTQSFALFDADHRLVDWDEGFENEWVFAAPALRRGMSYAEMLTAALSDPAAEQFVKENFGDSGLDSIIQGRIKTFGADRTWEYSLADGRAVRIDERRTRQGGIRRLARDITGEKQAGTALVEAQQRLEAADSDAEGVLTETRRNPDGSYVFQPISEGMRRLLRLPPDSVGQDAMAFYSRIMTTPEENMQRAAALERAVDSLEICSFEFKMRDGQDNIRWIRQSMMPRREADGTTIFSGAMRDITREKEAEDKVEMLHSVVVRSSDSIVIFESQPGPKRNSKIVYINQKFTDLFGWSADELVGEPIEILRPNNLDPEVARQMTAALLSDDGQPIEMESIGKDGRVFWIEMRISTIQRFATGGFRWAVIGRDISERRNTQMALLRAKEEAEAGNRAKSNFLANMSHELRTPLNAIIGFTELIADGIVRTGWIPAYGEYLADVGNSGRHLLELINTILDLSKIEAGSLQLNIAPLDVRELVNTSLALVSGLATGGNIALITDLPANCPEIRGDFMKLKQVLLNILSNAIKFTPAGGRIETSVVCGGDMATIAISDTGVGIAADDLERVTLPFFQVENTLSRKFAGSGLGLAIARELVALHGGKLEIDSAEGQGTTVRVTLPR